MLPLIFSYKYNNRLYMFVKNVFSCRKTGFCDAHGPFVSKMVPFAFFCCNIRIKVV